MSVQCAIMYFYVDLGTAIVSFVMFGGRMLPPLSQLSDAAVVVVYLLLRQRPHESNKTCKIGRLLYASAVSVPC